MNIVHLICLNDVFCLYVEKSLNSTANIFFKNILFYTRRTNLNILSITFLIDFIEKADTKLNKIKFFPTHTYPPKSDVVDEHFTGGRRATC